VNENLTSPLLVDTDGDGISDLTDTVTFNHCTTRGLAAPQPVAPLNSAIVPGSPTFQWTVNAIESDGARLDVCADRGCTSLIESMDVTGTSTTPASALPAGPVYWRVFAKSGEDIGCRPSAILSLVVDKEPPSITCPAPSSVECAGLSTPFSETASCTDDTSCTTSCSPGTSFPGPANCPAGASLDAATCSVPVTCTASDPAGNHSSCGTSLRVIDTTPPILGATLSASAALWPPDHRLVPTTVTITAADACWPTVAAITCIATSNEPDSGCGSGDQANDIQPTTQTLLDSNGGSMVFNLRAERCGNGDGRVYSISCSAVDGSNNGSPSTLVTVRAAHDCGLHQHSDGTSHLCD
jgi:hypothetical protein